MYFTQILNECIPNNLTILSANRNYDIMHIFYSLNFLFYIILHLSNVYRVYILEQYDFFHDISLDVIW